MKKAGWAFGILAAVLLAFLLGFALGRNEREGSVSIYYGASAPSASTAPAGNRPAAATGPAASGSTDGKDAASDGSEPANGPFESLEALINVKGIGEKTLAKILEYACTGG